MGNDKSYDIFKSPWKLIDEDEMDKSLAEAYLRKLCYNDDSLLSESDKVLTDNGIIDKLKEKLGSRLITILEDVSNLTQQRMMALDFATECLNVEQQYIRKMAKNSNKSFNKNAHSDAVRAVVNDSENALNFEGLRNLSDKAERSRRVNWLIIIMCLNRICNNDAIAATLAHQVVATIKNVVESHSLVTIADITKPLNSNDYSDKNYQILMQLISGPLRDKCSFDEVKAMFEAEFAVNSYEPEQIITSTDIKFSDLRELQLAHHFNRDETEPSYSLNEDKHIWIKELKDLLVNDIQLIMKIVEDKHKSYVVCECCYDEYEKNPENKEIWQPADDMFYLRYWEPDGRLNDCQEYTLAAPMIELSRLHIEGALIHPKRCKFCKKIMLPTAGFLASVSLAASISEIKGGGQLSREEQPDEDVICNHTAEALEQKLVMKDAVLTSISKNQSDAQVSEYRFIDWPSVTCRPFDDIQHSNIFTEQAYKSYFDSLSLVINQSADEQTMNDISNVAKHIIMCDAYAGYTYADYLCGLISMMNNDQYTLERLLLLCKVIYDSELEISIIEQICNAYNSPIFNSNLRDLNGTEKFDMSFGYENIQESINQIVVPNNIGSLMGFATFAELLTAMGVSKDFNMEVPNVDCSVLITADTKPEEAVHLLAEVKQFYTCLSAIAQEMRTKFFKEVCTYQEEYDESLKADPTKWLQSAWVSQSFNDTVFQLPIDLINSSAGLIEFIKEIDEDIYLSTIKQTAINLYNYNRTSKEKIDDLDDIADEPIDKTVVSLVDAYSHSIYTTFDLMREHIHAITLRSINIDSNGVWPSIDCLHSKVCVPQKTIYVTLSTIYMQAFTQEPDGGVEVSEAAEFAILIYYCCVANDTISERIKEAIKPIISEQLKETL